MEDTTTDETLSESLAREAAMESDDLAKQFFKPAYIWRGLKLRPYTGGTDYLFDQIIDPEDRGFSMFISFIFLHIYEDEEALLELCWDKLKFRKAVLEWRKKLGPLSIEDKKSAMQIFEDVRGWARKSSIEVVPDASLPQKKTRVSRRQRSRG
jgi:hypothetical protein